MRLIGMLWHEAMKARSLFVEADGTDDAAAGGGGSAATPTYVTSEEFKSFTASMTGFMQTMQSTIAGFQALAANANAGNASRVAVDEVSEEQYAEAVANGDAKTIARWTRQETTKAVQAAVGPLQAVGLDSLGALSREVASARMPHYNRYKREIDERLNSLDPVTRVRPEALSTVYASVVGMHHDELVKEATEAAIRTANAGTSAASAGGGTTSRSGGGGGGGSVPSVAELLGTEAAAALASVGRDADTHARSLGHASWADYAKFVKDQEVAT